MPQNHKNLKNLNTKNLNIQNEDFIASIAQNKPFHHKI